MASSRRIGTNENISTYGNETRDYQEGELSLWEQATDYDLVTATTSEVLECCDDQDSFDDYIILEDTVTNSNYLRIVRPASGHGHNGTCNNGFTLVSTTAANVIGIKEAYSQVQDILGKLIPDSASNLTAFYANGNYSVYVGCIVFDSANAGSGAILAAFGIAGDDSVGCINCLSHGNEQRGFNNSSSNGFLHNCNAINNGTYGFRTSKAGAVAKNCCSSGNGTTDWNGTWTKTTCTDEGATPVYEDAGNNNYHLAFNDTVCKGQGTDLSGDGTYPFDDDIDGEVRSAAWDIGIDEQFLFLSVLDIYHEHHCDAIHLTIVLPPPQEIYHEHRADSLIVTDSMQDTYHRHTADNVVLEQYVPGPHYLGIAIELPTIGPTQYQGYNFNSMVKFGDVYLGANSHGIYTLDTKDTDQDAQIRATLKTMTTDLGIVNQKRIRKAYLGYETSGSLILTLYDNDNNARTYTLTSTLVSQEQHSGEVPVDRNGKGRYWAFKIENVQGCDFSIDELSIIPLVLTRKP